MRGILLSIFLFLLCPASAMSKELDISLSYKVVDKKLYVVGKSNLLPGVKLGVTLSNQEQGFSAQDFDVYVDSKGAFITSGFSNAKHGFTGKVEIQLFTYFNQNWHKEPILTQLKSYTGSGVILGDVSDIIPGGGIEIDYHFSLPSDSSKKNPKHSTSVRNFCYALQAGMSCDGLQMRIDTEDKIENLVGEPIRGPKSRYNDDCIAGLSLAHSEKGADLCSKAWLDFGCNGKTTPRLLQENSFKNRNGSFCSYGD